MCEHLTALEIWQSVLQICCDAVMTLNRVHSPFRFDNVAGRLPGLTMFTERVKPDGRDAHLSTAIQSYGYGSSDLALGRLH